MSDETRHARNAVPADEFNTAKMEQAESELNTMKLRYLDALAEKVNMQATINNLSAKLSKVAKTEKREANKVRL